MPEEGDQVVGDQGARVFLGPNAAAMLDDKVLDATVDEQGRIGFVSVPNRRRIDGGDASVLELIWVAIADNAQDDAVLEERLRTRQC